LPIEWSSLKPVLKFSLSIIITSSVWVFVTQTDKLVLSKILPLADFGYFTLAVMAAGGVLLLVAPVTGAVMPLMVRLAAERDQAGFVRVYRTATQLVVVIAGSASITLGYCAEPLLLAWTNNDAIAYHASPILMLYAIGNGILAISGFPYLLQYAKGDLRLHLIGNILYAALLIPLIIWSAKKYGGIGAGYVWVTLNLIFFLIWVPYIHKKVLPGIGMKWFFQDVLPIYISALIVGYVVRQNISFTVNSKWQLLLVLLFGLLVLIASVFSSTVFWSRGKFYIRRLYG
jgi:O-antigen/teichoic acid export membrane protein